MARPPNTPNKSTQRGRDLFAPHVQTAIDACLAILKRSSIDRDDVVANIWDRPKDSDVLAAAKMVCEYGLGKPSQPLGDVDGNPPETVRRIIIETAKAAIQPEEVNTVESRVQ